MYGIVHREKIIPNKIFLGGFVLFSQCGFLHNFYKPLFNSFTLTRILVLFLEVSWGEMIKSLYLKRRGFCVKYSCINIFVLLREVNLEFCGRLTVPIA